MKQLEHNYTKKYALIIQNSNLTGTLHFILQLIFNDFFPQCIILGIKNELFPMSYMLYKAITGLASVSLYHCTSHRSLQLIRCSRHDDLLSTLPTNHFFPRFRDLVHYFPDLLLLPKLQPSLLFREAIPFLCLNRFPSSHVSEKASR